MQGVPKVWIHGHFPFPKVDISLFISALSLLKTNSSRPDSMYTQVLKTLSHQSEYLL